MEKSEIEKGMEGKELSEMNRHELAVVAGNAIGRVKAAQEKLKSAFDNLPTTAKMAAGAQLEAAAESLDAVCELAIVTHAELGLLTSSNG
jgi:hypothetical protein